MPTTSVWDRAAGLIRPTIITHGDNVELDVERLSADIRSILRATERQRRGEIGAVGLWPPNELGFFDLLATTWEWCDETVDGQPVSRLLEEENLSIPRSLAAVVKGGPSVDESSDYLTVVGGELDLGSRVNSVGFRVMCLGPPETFQVVGGAQ
jgi:formylglycine-generating enzyme required for sulfatase activity